MAAAEALGGNGTTSAVMRTLFLPPPYQDSAEGCLILRDGFTGFVRLSESSDRGALRECFNPLSSESKRQRFFSIADRAEALLEQQCDSSNPRLQLTLIVSRIVKARPESFATGSYVARDETTGEFAFARGCFRLRLPQKRQAARYTTAAPVRSVADASTPVETTIFEGASHDRDH